MKFAHSDNLFELIDWDSDRLRIELAVELPFWVLVDDFKYEIEINGCVLSLETVACGIDVQNGTFRSRNNARCTYFGRFPKIEEPGIHSTIDLIQGANFRRTYTQCWITTAAVGDAVVALHDEAPRCVIAREYLVSLAMAHLPFLNKFINSYRRVSADPFAQELTEHDVPLWFLVNDGKLFPICLLPYFVQDDYLKIRPNYRSDVAVPYFAASPDELILALNRQPVQGEAELRDAWSLCYRGRFGDSIRSAVTAIEVLLEAKLKDILQSKNQSSVEMEARLKKTEYQFFARLDDYCRESGRAVPGPTLSWIPYLNGLRLREQFRLTRELRHNIVHRGMRLDPSLKKPMRWALETTTWLFDWLSEQEPVGDRQIQNYTFSESLRGFSRMSWEIRDDGVDVRPIFHESSENIRDNASCLAEMPEARIVRSIFVSEFHDAVFHATLNRFPDFEHFVLMALAKLGFDQADDVFQDPLVSDRRPRWHADHAQTRFSVFLFESDGTFTPDDFETYCQAIKAISNGESPLLVVHDRKGVEWTSRSTECPNADIGLTALSSGVAVVRADDLARFASTASSKKWSVADIAPVLQQPGWNRLGPINTTVVGEVRRYFPKPKVISIDLNGTTDVSIGDLLWVRLRNRLQEFPVLSMEKDKVPVVIARTGCVGIEVEIEREDVVAGGDVFLDLQAKARPIPTSGVSALQQLLGGFRGGF